MASEVESIQRSINQTFKAAPESPSIPPNQHITFRNAKLDRFSPRKLFEVIIANELTPQCAELLKGIIEIHKESGNDSNIVFISRNSLTSFIDDVVNNIDETGFEHPPQLVDHLRRLCNNLHNSLKRNEDISRKQLTLIMKHKLINEMYTQYAKDARLDHEICQKEESINKLQKKDYQKQIRFSQMEISESTRKNTKYKKIDLQNNFQMNDYTYYPLPDNLLGSDDLKDHIYFYVFVGFQDPCLLKLLIRYNVPVSCILQICR